MVNFLVLLCVYGKLILYFVYGSEAFKVNYNYNLKIGLFLFKYVIYCTFNIPDYLIQYLQYTYINFILSRPQILTFRLININFYGKYNCSFS